MIYSLLIGVIIGLLFQTHKLKKQIEINNGYKESYFKEQHQSEAYRACLYVAIKDMIANGWYNLPSEAFHMLFCRLYSYRFSHRLNESLLIARMLYHQNHIKFSHDYEEELMEEDRCF